VNQCERFRWRYNSLSYRFAKAESSEFVDREAADRVMQYTRRTIGDFCDVETYRAKYPKMIVVMSAAAAQAFVPRSASEVPSVGGLYQSVEK
jgi:hypothetical protein